jgi:hypothetical protein
MFQALKYVPAHVGSLEGEVVALAGVGLIAVAGLTVPFWATTERTRALARWGGVATLIVMAVLTLLAYRAEAGR